MKLIIVRHGETVENKTGIIEIDKDNMSFASKLHYTKHLDGLNES